MSGIFRKIGSFEKTIFSYIISNFKDFYIFTEHFASWAIPTDVADVSEGTSSRILLSRQPLQCFACIYLEHVTTSNVSSNYTSVGIGIHAVNHKDTSLWPWCY